MRRHDPASRYVRKRAQILADIAALERNRQLPGSDVEVLDGAIRIQQRRVEWLEELFDKATDELEAEQVRLRERVGPSGLAVMEDGLAVGLSPEVLVPMLRLALVNFVLKVRTDARV